ncbi:MAG: acetyl-CoA decarbonylase/synthase complex subunit gamma [Armatimonadota bacterium]|nr:MAG: acetyl-CoA decarbonylase/synthase complex subunit gamma [Armatimonadota bacterium]
MGLTGLDIYKHLPKTNCGDCGVPTCLAFAMKLAQKQTSLDKCPHVTDDAKAALEGASAPPVKLVTAGVGDAKVEVGNETVLFRHDETFYHPTALAVTVDAALPEDQLVARVKQINELVFDRVGQRIGVNMVALQSGADAAQFAAAAKAVAANTDHALVLIADDPAAMEAAVKEVADRKPLIYAATADNAEDMARIAKENSCPLALRADGLEALAALSQKVQGLGVTDLVLDSGAREPVKVLADQTLIRRAALRKKFRPLGFPTIAFTAADSPEEEVVQATEYVAKYAGILVMNADQPWQLIAILTARQNIFTDPQKPIQLDAGLYQVGEPDANSPVLTTTNFSLTYFTVEGDVEASRVPSWIVVVDTEGTSVLTAWAAEKFTADTIAAAIKSSGIEDKVSHRKLVIPGGVAVLSGKLQEASGWQVLVGPRESSGIPTYLKTTWQG